MNNKLRAKDFVPSQHAKRTPNRFLREAVVIGLGMIAVLGVFNLLGWLDTAPTAQAATPACLVVNELPASGK